MGFEIGILLAFVAMLCWGFGDFLIQKSTRKFGDWETLFFITLFGTIILFPFIYKNLPAIFSFNKTLFVLVLASSVLFIAALFEFESLKRGKISVVEPLWSLEIPVSALLAFLILKEEVSFKQGIFVVSLIAGLVLVSLRSSHLSKKVWLEKGVVLSIIAAALMGAANFFVGFGARLSDALIINWFLCIFITILSGIFLLFTGRLKKAFSDIQKSKKLLLSMCILDNGAWIAFAFAMILTPIAIAVSLSESYIIISVILGMFISKEKLRHHQKIGLVLAIISAIVLASLS